MSSGSPRFASLGGPGSIFADLDSLEHVGARHADIARTARELSAGMAGLALDLAIPSRVCPSAGVLRGRLDDGARATQALADRLHDMHATLARVCGAYRAVEEGAAVSVAMADPALSGMPALTPGWGLDGIGSAEVERALSEDAIAAQADLVGGMVESALEEALSLVPMLGSVLFSAKVAKRLEPVEDLARSGLATLGAKPVAAMVEDGMRDRRIPSASVPELLQYGSAALIATGTIAAGGPVDVVGEPRPRPAPAELDGSASGLMDLVPSQEGTDGPGAVVVTRVAAADGDTWVVGLPGTRAPLRLSEVGDDPFDANGLVEAWARDPHVTRAVEEALRTAGAPAGARVVLAGVSQGGVRAVNAAADPGFAGRYDVQGLVTYGAPAAGMPVPGSVWALDFTAGDDMLASVDGGTPPVGPRRATVTLEPTAAIIGRGTRTRAAAAEVLTPRTLHRPRSPLDGALMVDSMADEAARDLAATGEALRQDVAAGHAPDTYRRRIADHYEAAPAEARAETAEIQARLREMTAGPVVSSTVHTLRRRSAVAPARQDAETPPQGPVAPSRTPVP